MIKKLEVEDIIKIINIDNNVEDFFPCERGEWVQWLIQNIDSPDLFIIGDVIEEELKGHIVAVNNISPPISNHVSVLYFQSTDNKKVNLEIRDKLIDWAKEKGANKVLFICKNIRVFHKYGATQQAILGGWNL